MSTESGLRDEEAVVERTAIAETTHSDEECHAEVVEISRARDHVFGLRGLGCSHFIQRRYRYHDRKTDVLDDGNVFRTNASGSKTLLHARQEKTKLQIRPRIVGWRSERSTPPQETIIYDLGRRVYARSAAEGLSSEIARERCSIRNGSTMY